MLVNRWNINYFDEVESTNLIVKDKIKNSPNVELGYVAVAKSQTGGKGMRGHSWSSPVGGLYFSALLEVSLPQEELHEIPLYVANVIKDTLQPLCDEELAIKPPNDIVTKRSLDAFLQGKEKSVRHGYIEKLVGISTEIYMKRLCLGVGINVFRPKVDLQVEGENVPVYLEDHSVNDLSLDLLLNAVLEALNDKLVL